MQFLRSDFNLRKVEILLKNYIYVRQRREQRNELRLYIIDKTSSIKFNFEPRYS